MTMTRASDTIRTIMSDLDMTCEVIIVLSPTTARVSARRLRAASMRLRPAGRAGTLRNRCPPPTTPSSQHYARRSVGQQGAERTPQPQVARGPGGAVRRWPT